MKIICLVFAGFFGLLALLVCLVLFALACAPVLALLLFAFLAYGFWSKAHELDVIEDLSKEGE